MPADALGYHFDALGSVLLVAGGACAILLLEVLVLVLKLGKLDLLLRDFDLPLL